MLTTQKLVRDLLLREETTPADPELASKLFSEKLMEEYKEYLTALSALDEKRELADLLEVVHSIIRRAGFSVSEVEVVRQQRFDLAGGFDRASVWTLPPDDMRDL